MLNRIRPEELSPHELRLFNGYESGKAAAAADTASRRKKRTLTEKLWDNVGEHLFGA